MTAFNSMVGCVVILSIAFLIVCIFEKYKNWKLNNIPLHYRTALIESGYDIYCDYKNEWFSWNKWGIRKLDDHRATVLFSADEFYSKLKGCFTYTTNKIYVNNEKVHRLYEVCNTVPKKNLKEW